MPTLSNETSRDSPTSCVETERHTFASERERQGGTTSTEFPGHGVSGSLSSGIEANYWCATG